MPFRKAMYHAMTSRKVRAEMIRAPAIAVHIMARWVLPDPSGPTSAKAFAGQSGQEPVRALYIADGTTAGGLRERLQDVPLLAAHFVQKYARENHKAIVAMQQEAIEHLMQYNWPGNVRELENVIERAVVLARGAVITPAEKLMANLGRQPC